MVSEKLIKINFYLLLILPITLISGPLIPDLIVIISCIFICFYFKSYKLKLLKNKLFLALFFLWVISVVSSSFSNDIFFSLKSSFFYIRILIFILVINIIFKINEKNLFKILNVLILTFIVLFIDSSYQKFYGYNLIGIVSEHSARISSFFGDELILGSYLVKFYPILVAFLYLIKTSRFIIYFIVLSIITFIPIFLSAEKTALVIFFIEFLSITCFIKSNIKIKIVIILSFIILFLFMFFSFPKIKNRIYDQLIANSANFKYLYTRVHTEHYISGLKMFEDNPIIGVGPKMFRKVCDKSEYKISEFSCSTHPHNYSVQILAETGIFGFIFFLSFYFFLIRDFIRLVFQNNNNKFKFPLYSLLILNLINFMPLFPSGNFFNNWVSITYSFGLGVYFYFREKYEERL